MRDYLIGQALLQGVLLIAFIMSLAVDSFISAFWPEWAGFGKHEYIRAQVLYQIIFHLSILIGLIYKHFF